MKVFLAESAGFCWGVRRAVEKARSLARSSGDPIYTDGALIHNRQMMDQLRAENIVETSDPGSLTSGVLLIRAHGVPPARRAMLERLPLSLDDATCPDVASIQRHIAEHAAEGYSVVIFGDPGHAEVEGLLGCCSQNNGFVVAGVSDIGALPDMDRVCLVAQSTQLPMAYERVAEAMRKRFPGVKVLDTICRSTKNRQSELARIAVAVDAIVVVGDPNSANTMRLVELARSMRPTIHIQTAAQVVVADFAAFRSVGLTAGASTPSFIIEAVKARLEQIEG